MTGGIRPLRFKEGRRGVRSGDSACDDGRRYIPSVLDAMVLEKLGLSGKVRPVCGTLGETPVFQKSEAGY
jgi:hypothetical protein